MGPPKRARSSSSSSCTSTRGAVLMLVSLCCCCCNRALSFSPGPSAFLGGATHRSAFFREGSTTTTPMGTSSSQAAAAPAPVMAAGSRSGRKREKVRKALRRSSLHAAQMRGSRWGSEVWDKLKVPPDGRAHDEVTFRSGFEGEALTIPQGGPGGRASSAVLCCLFIESVTGWLALVP